MGFKYRASRKKEAKKRSKNSKGEDCVEIRYCDIPGMSKEVLRNMGNAKYRPVKIPDYKYKDLCEHGVGRRERRQRRPRSLAQHQPRVRVRVQPAASIRFGDGWQRGGQG